MLVELQGEETIDAHTFANACVRNEGRSNKYWFADGHVHDPFDE